MPEKETIPIKEAMPKIDSIGNLTGLANKDIEIISFEMLPAMGTLGEGALVTLKSDGKIGKYHTFSLVLIKQLKTIAPILKNKKVLARVSKRKNYYVFE